MGLVYHHHLKQLLIFLLSPSIALHHTDALLTQYELNAMSQDLNDITDALEENCDCLEELKNRLEQYENHECQRIIQVKTRFIYLTNLYANLLTRLRALRIVCDHSIQVMSETSTKSPVFCDVALF